MTLRAGLSTSPVPLTMTVPFPATQSSMLGCANNQSCLTGSNCGNNYSCTQALTLWLTMIVVNNLTGGAFLDLRAHLLLMQGGPFHGTDA